MHQRNSVRALAWLALAALLALGGCNICPRCPDTLEPARTTPDR
jgi:hypothetical protein